MRLNRSEGVEVAAVDKQVSLLREHAPKLRTISAYGSLFDSVLLRSFRSQLLGECT
jgi:hypothetical protein